MNLLTGESRIQRISAFRSPALWRDAFSVKPVLFVVSAALGSALLPAATAQVGTDRIEGLRDNTPRWHAITGARIVVSPDKIIERGTLVMRDGVVVAVGTNVAVPAGAREWKLDGHTVYPGFIDLASSVGVPL